MYTGIHQGMDALGTVVSYTYSGSLLDIHLEMNSVDRFIIDKMVEKSNTIHFMVISCELINRLFQDY